MSRRLEFFVTAARHCSTNSTEAEQLAEFVLVHSALIRFRAVECCLECADAIYSTTHLTFFLLAPFMHHKIDVVSTRPDISCENDFFCWFWRVLCFNRILENLVKILLLPSKEKVFPGRTRAHKTSFMFSFLYCSNSLGLFSSPEQDRRRERRRLGDTQLRVTKFEKRQKSRKK